MMKHYKYCLYFFAMLLTAGCASQKTAEGSAELAILHQIKEQKLQQNEVTLENCLKRSSNPADTVEKFFKLAKFTSLVKLHGEALAANPSSEYHQLRLIQNRGKQAEASAELCSTLGVDLRHDLTVSLVLPPALPPLQLPELELLEKCAVISEPGRDVQEKLLDFHLNYIRLLTAYEKAAVIFKSSQTGAASLEKRLNCYIEYRICLHKLYLQTDLSDMSSKNLKSLREKLFFLEHNVQKPQLLY